MVRTGEQADRGLAGLFIIDHEMSDSLDIPKEYGVDEIPFVIQDREFDRNAQLVYGHEQRSLTSGMLGSDTPPNTPFDP